MPPDGVSGPGELFGPRLELGGGFAAPPPIPDPTQKGVSLLERPVVGGQVRPRRGPVAEEEPVEKTPPGFRRAGHDRAVFGREEYGRRETGRLAERDFLPAPTEPSAGARRPLDRKILGREPAPQRPLDREALAVGGHVGRARATERPLSAQERDRLQEVRLPLSVLADDEVPAGAKGDDVGREVTEAAGRQLEQAQDRSRSDDCRTCLKASSA